MGTSLLYRRTGHVLLPAAAALLLVAGCAGPFPKEAVEKVDRSIAFQDLQKDPGRFKGKWVLLAGAIVETKQTKEGTVIEVLQRPADSKGRPRSTDASKGRFLIVSPEFLDSAIFAKGRLISVIGDVAGERVLPLDEIQYRYPVVNARNLHLWEPSAPGPRFQFGIGIMHVR